MVKLILLLSLFCVVRLSAAVEKGEIIDPGLRTNRTSPVTDSVEPKDLTPEVTPDVNATISRIECENDPKEFFTLYPEDKKMGLVRLSSGVEPVFKGFFSYAFSYDVSKTKNGAIYLTINRDVSAFKEMSVPLYGDGSKNEVRIRLVDKDGEVFTTVLGKIIMDWNNEWRTITLSPSDFEFTDWAETNAVNKIMDYPVVIQKIYFVYMKGGAEKGVVFLDDITIH